MIQQEINLNLVPSSEPVVVHCNQYDEGKGRIIAHLYNGSHPYTPGANATVKVQGTKPDNHAFQYWCDISGSTVTVDVNIQMTAVAGRTPTQLIVNETSGVTGSFAFYLDVQASTLPPTIDVSETDIPILTEEAQEAARRAVQAAGAAEDSADRAASWSSNPPYIGENNNWFVYDIENEQFVDSGILARGTDGEDGERGSLWYRGTAVSGKSADPTVYPTGIADALAGDMYLNVTEGAIYHCVTGGSASVATWAYDFTLTGGGGGGGTDNYNDLINQPQIGGVTLVGNKTISELGGVQSFNGRSGSILPIAGDYKSSQIILSSVMHIGGETQDTVQEALEALEEHGGGGGLYPYLYIDSEAGAIVTVDAPDGSTITPTPAGSGHWECELPAYGVYVIHSVLSGQGDATYSLTVDDVKEYHITDSHYDFTIYVTADNGSTVRVSAGDEVYTGTGSGSAVAFVVHQPSTVYTIEETLDGVTDTDTVTSASTSGESASVTVHVFEAVLNIGTTSSELRGQTITIKKGSTTIGTTAFSSSGSATFRVHEIGTYTAECTYSGDTYYSDAVSVSAETTYPMSIDIVTTPDGKTVTPTDDIQIWLACADITDKTYTTLSEVLADRETLYRLMANDNAVDYLVRSTTWAASNGEGKIPTMTGPTTPSGEASGSSYATDKEPWKAFDGDDSTWWQTSSSDPGTLTYTFSSAVTLRRFSYKAAVYQSSSLRIKDFKILASNDGFVSDSHELYSGTHDKTAFSDPTYGEGILNNDSPYTSYRMQIINTDASNVNPGVVTLQYYDTIGIPDSKYAMKYIGKWNYASDTLLSDSIWLDAIYGGEYMEEVLNTKVPTLTAASANAGASAVQGEGYVAWRAFNGNNSSYGWMPPSAWGHYVYYHFDSPVSIKKASILLYDSTSRAIKNTVQVIASNDNSVWTPISAEFTMSGTNVTDNITLNNNSSYSYYGVKVISSTSGHSADKGQGYHIQFYGRQDVTEGLIDIYSAASDTVYYMDNGSSVTVCTTDTSGHGTVAKSSLPNGTYTLYSTVNHTSKTVTVTDGTAEIDLT
jgi:hypothetical protein